MAQRTLRAAKNIVRKEIRQKLRALPEEEKTRESNIIMQRLLELDVYKNAASVCTYLHMPTEVYTTQLLQNLFTSNKKCFIPHYVGDNMDMVALRGLEDYDSLPLTAWNIKQPADDEQRERATDGAGLDVVIVPALAFTVSGDRLGRGKGYYDNYFVKYEKVFGRKPVTVGLAYSCQVLDVVPVDEFDVKLDHVVTAL